MISFYSTNGSVPDVNLGQALLQGQAGDKGLYLPKSNAPFSKELLQTARDLSYPELATQVLSYYTDGIFSPTELEEICHGAYNFDVPLEHVADSRYIMRLDQGPTASFKDFAARFMGRALGKLVQRAGHDILILTATSGDTGSAVAQAFAGVPGVKVLVLFPRGEVSLRQRKQMTTLGGNIATLSVDGKFDDCQELVKQAFADPDLASMQLSSANSINIGRLLPQSIYYLYSATKLADIAGGEEVIFSVPSGNFGNLMGGVLAWRRGLRIKKFVVATNANDEVPTFWKTDNYSKIEPSRVCISNAMNVGHPSNLARLVDLYGGKLDEKGKLLKQPDMDSLRNDFHTVSIDDNQTRQSMGKIFKEHGTVLEPHGAVGWAGLENYLSSHPEAKGVTSITLETAHPAKFPDEVMAITGTDPELPPSLEGLEELSESYGEMEVSYEDFKNYLQSEY
jgi:threonine synthase